MKRKLNARTITLLSLIGALLCALMALFAFTNLFDSNSENTETASAASKGETPVWRDFMNDGSIDISSDGQTAWVDCPPNSEIELDTNHGGGSVLYGGVSATITAYGPAQSITLNIPTAMGGAAGKGISLTFVDGNNWNPAGPGYVMLNFKCSYGWADGTTGTKTLRVYPKFSLDTPTISKASSTFSTSTQTFTVSSTTNLTWTLPDGWSMSSGTVTIPKNAAAGTYTIKAEPYGTHDVWKDSGEHTTKSFTYTINRASLSTPSLAASSKTWSASSQTVSVFSYSSYLVTTSLPTGWSWGSSVTIPASAAVNSYTIKVKPDDNHCWTDNTYGEKSLPISITRAVVAEPTLSKSTATYSQSSQTFTISSVTYLTVSPPSGWTRSGTTITIPAGKAVDKYSVSVTPDSNHCWSGGGTEAKSLPIEITAQSISLGTITLATTDFVYDKQAKTPTVSSVTVGSETVPASDYTVAYSNNINAGTATVTVTAKNNYKDSCTTTFSIDKATPTASPTISAGTYIAGSPLQSVGISGTGSVSGSFSWSDPSTILTMGSAKYEWTFEPADTDNYYDVTGKVTVAALGMDSIKADGQKTTYKAFEKFTTEGMTVYAVSGNTSTPITGYTYSVAYGDGRDYFLVSDSGCEVTITYVAGDLTKTFTFTVTVIKADVDMRGVTFEDTSATYDGQLHTLTYSGDLPAGVSFSKYTYDGEENNTGVIYAGDHEVKVYFTVTDSANYNAPTLTATLTINKATPTVNVTVADGYYYVGDGLSTVTLEADMAGTISFTNASGIITGLTGSYGWTFTPDDADNYEEVTGSVEVEAVPKLVSISVTGANTSYKAHESFDPTGMVVTASYATGKVDTAVEDYTVSYPRENATDFIIADDGSSMTVTYTENGITVTAEITLTIIANGYDMSGVSMDDLTVSYDGKNHELTITGEPPEGVTFKGFKYNGTESADGVKNADTYEVEVVFEIDDPDNYKMPELKATLTINKATPTVKGVELVSGKYYKGAALSTVHLTYDEDGTSPEGSLDWADGTVKLGTAEDGRYKWVFTPDDTTNYETVEGWIEIGNLQAKVEGIEVIDPTTAYEAYDSFVTEGVKVLVTYLDETTEEVDISDCTLVYPDSSRDHFLVGDDKITVWYGNVSVTVSVTVSKKPVDMSGVTFDDKLNEVYDGSLKSIIAENLPDGIEVDYYTYAGEEDEGVTDVGTYEVKVYFTVADDPDNIEVPEAMTATLKIAQAEPEITVEVDYGRYPEGTMLSGVALKYECEVAGTLSWTVGGIEIEDDGEYEWTFKPTDTKNYKTVKGTLTVEIFYEVNSIQVTVNKSEYEAYDTLGKTDITVKANFVDKAPANVDGWTVTYPNGGDCFLVDDTGKDVIITYNDAEFIIHVTVTKKTVDMSGVTFDDKLNEVYTGSLKSIVAENLPEGVAVDHYSYNDETVNGVKDAGDYTVTVYFKVTDENLTIETESKTANLHVDKADSVLTFNGTTEFAYTGKTVTITSGASVDNSEQTSFSYTNNTFLNVSDSGVMTVSVAASKNYKGTSIDVDVTVTPAELTLTWTGGNATYDGYSHSAELTVVSGAVEDDKDAITTENLAGLITVSYTGADTDRKQKGDYTVTLTSFPENGIYANYTYTVTNDPYTFTIGDSELNITFKGDTVVYDGDVHTLVAEGLPAPEEMTVTYYCDGVVFNGATDAGTYEVEARFECLTENFTAPDSMYATLTIKAKSISGCDVDGVDKEHIYDGKAYRPEDVTVTLNGKELVKGEDFEVTYTGSGANADSTGEVIITGKGNFGGSVEIEYVIVPRELEIEWDKDDYYYNGDPQGVTAHLTNVVDGEEVNIEITYTGTGYESTTMPTKAGTYTATVTLDSPYKNYTLNAVSETFEIKMADVEVELNYAEGYKGNLFDGMAMPGEDVLIVLATSDGKEVEGKFTWTQTSFVWGTSEYSWTFVPDDSNYNVKQGTETFTVREAKITMLTVAWVDGAQPAIYTSTTLDAIRNYLVVTGTLENNQTIDIAGYALTCDGFVGQVPSRPATYTLKVKFNGKDATISVKYDAVDCNGLRIENADGKEVKTDYYTFDKFDTSTIKVIATFTDGSESVLSATEYQIVYVTDGSETMLYGDKYVKVNYNGMEEPIYVNVEKKPYNTSSWSFGDKSSTYNGNGQTYTIEGVGDDFYVEYEYYKKNSDGTWTKLASKDEVKNAGEYKIVATILPVGNISDNYTYPESLEAMLTITKLTPDIGKPGVGGNLSVGTKLSELSLSVEVDGITGTFVWDNEEQVLKEGINICRYTFIPDDPNYNVVRGSIELPAGSAALPDGGDTIGGVGGSGVSEGMFAAIMVILVASILISLLALIVAFKRKSVVSDTDGFYDDVAKADLK